ncbi:hypothetical protein [Paenibacillus sinopodophylli]|uniref:hypothetical protein n=1 Tax=Paenibacillus sinopodophylli TaxID=1837342 RepID=UPI00110CC2BC|nr:hypothetical protein [Paenibacillus sinopodophylli]
MKIRIGLIVLVVIAIGIAAYVYRAGSVKMLLHKEGFSRTDIIAEEGYSVDASRLTKVLLGANENEMGIVILEQNSFGLWDNQNSYFVLDKPDRNRYALGTFTIIKNGGAALYTEKHWILMSCKHIWKHR